MEEVLIKMKNLSILHKEVEWITAMNTDEFFSRMQCSYTFSL